MSSEFIIFIERWLAGPLVGYLIAHGMVNPKDASFWSDMLGQAMGGGFVILVYILTHYQLQKANTQEQAVQQSLWSKFLTFAFGHPNTPVNVTQTVAGETTTLSTNP